MGDPAKNAFDVKDFLAKVGVGKTVLKFQKNQTVFTQGDTAESVYYIQLGKTKLTVISQHDKEAVVGILGPGQFFGEGCMNGHPLRIATTTAIENWGNYKTGYEGHPSRPAGVFRVVRGVSSDPQQPDRRGPDRPAFQFK
jgi:hypothetical protein